MERMTIRAGALTLFRGKGGYKSADEMSEMDMISVLERLAAIEDVLGDEYDLERLREMLEEHRDYDQAAKALDEMRESAFQRLMEAEAAEQRELEAQHRADQAEAELAALKASLSCEQKERP